VIKEFKETWEFASNYACHATMGAMMGHQEYSSPEKFEYDFFDLIGDDHLNNRGRQFWFVLKAHLRILQVFEEVFEKSLSDKWKEDRRKLTGETEWYIERFIKPHLTKVRQEERKKRFAKAGLVAPEDGMLLKSLKGR
jgi:hypothetical protein